jgi:hypothetical protein
MSEGNVDKRDWVLAGDSGMSSLFLGQLGAGLHAELYMARLGSVEGSPIGLELYNARLIMHQTVPLTLPNGTLTMQTIFKVMPFPANADGGHVVLLATMIIDVEGDPITKELLMLQLRECNEMENVEKARRSKLTIPSIIHRS